MSIEVLDVMNPAHLVSVGAWESPIQSARLLLKKVIAPVLHLRMSSCGDLVATMQKY